MWMTLEECFIKAKNRFPFKVEWKDRGEYIILSRVPNEHAHISEHKYYWNPNRVLGGSDGEDNQFRSYASEKRFRLVKPIHQLPKWF